MNIGVEVPFSFAAEVVPLDLMERKKERNKQLVRMRSREERVLGQLTSWQTENT